MGEERVVLIRPRTVLTVAGVLVGLALALWIVWAARHIARLVDQVRGLIDAAPATSTT
jgi:hypothetical protein